MPRPAVEKKRPKSVEKKPKSVADALAAAGLSTGRVSTTVVEPEALTLIRDKAHDFYDPRVEIEPDPSDPFYQDVKAHGVRDAVKVLRDGTERNGKPRLLVIDGRQRVQVLMHLNKHEPTPDGKPRRLKVDFITEGDRGKLVLLSLATNHHRRDETPYTRAVKMGKAKMLGRTAEEIAQACGWRDVFKVELYLSLLTFHAEVQQAFNGELPENSIRHFARVPYEEQVKALEVVRASGASTVKQRATAIEAARAGQEYKAPETNTRVARTWPRDKLDLLSVRLGEAAESLRATPGTGSAHIEARACQNLLRYMLGDREALNAHPELLAIVAPVAAER